MQTTIVKCGNNREIVIPEVFLKNIQIAENDSVDVILEKEKIIIKKGFTIQHRTTKERLSAFYGRDINEDYVYQTEFDWGANIGKEIW